MDLLSELHLKQWTNVRVFFSGYYLTFILQVLL